MDGNSQFSPKKVIAAGGISFVLVGGALFLFYLLSQRGAEGPETPPPEFALQEAASGETGKHQVGPLPGAQDSVKKKGEEEETPPPEELGPPLLSGHVLGGGKGIPGAKVHLFSAKLIEETLIRLERLAPRGGELPDIQIIVDGIRKELDTIKNSAIVSQTDDEGYYEFRKISPGGYINLTLAEGWLFRYGDVASLSRERPEKLDLELDRGARIAGRVVNTQGHGVPGVTVVAEFRPGGMAGIGILVRRLLRYVNGEFLRGPFQTISGEEGSFELVSLPPGVYDLAAEKPGGVEARLQGIATGTEEALIYLGEGARVFGNFVDKSGAPLEKVRLKLERQDDLIQLPLPAAGFNDLANSVNQFLGQGPRMQTTGSQGEFQLGPLAPGKYRLSVKQAGYLPFQRDFELEWNQMQNLGLQVLDSGEAIRGIVRSEDGLPLAGAKVLATPARMNFLNMGGVMSDFLSARTTVATDSSGAFFLGGLLKGTYNLTATSPGFAPEVKRQVGSGGDPVEFILKEGFRISGIVRESPEGEPIGGARVEAGGVRAETAEDGSFVLDGVVPRDPSMNPFDFQQGPRPRRQPEGEEQESVRSVRIRASAPGFLAARETIEVESEEARVEIELERVLSIQGIVFDPEGNPAPGSLVRLTPAIPEGFPVFDFFDRGLIFLAVSMSDLEGKFRFSGFRGARAESRYQVLADHVLYARGFSESFSVPRSGEEEMQVEVRLEKGAKIRGQVTDGKQAIPGAAVRLRKARREGEGGGGRGMEFFMNLLGLPKGGEVAYTDGEGNFDYGRVAAGDYVLSAEMAGFIESPSQTISVGPGEERQVNFEMDPGGEISGWVLEGSGIPISGVRIRLLRETGGGVGSDEQLLQAQRFLGGSFKSARSDGEGFFRIPGLPGGRYIILVNHPGFIPYEEAGVVLQEEPRKIVLLPAAKIRLQVSDVATGQPIQQFRVRLKRTGGEENPRDFLSRMGQEHQDQDGIYERGDLAEGKYEVRLESTGYAPSLLEVVLSPGEVAERRIFLSRAGRIRGFVLDANTRAPIPGASINFQRSRREPVETSEKNGKGGGDRAKESKGEQPPDPREEDSRAMGEFFSRDLINSPSSGNDGSFLVEGVPEEPQTVIATHPDYIPGSKDGVEVGLGEEIEAVFLLRPGFTISGRIRDSAGKPAQGRFVFARGTSEANAQVRKSAVTTSQGEFEIRGLQEGPYRLLVPRRSGRGQPEPLEIDLRQDESELEILLPAE